MNNRPMTEREENEMLKERIEKLEKELKYAQQQWNDYSKYKVSFLTLVDVLKKGY
jgi:cell division septum initiation protein DivIVA